MDNFYFNYKDLFKAPRMAIGPQRISLAMLGLMLTHVIYLFFTYLSILIGGHGIAEVWKQMGLSPALMLLHYLFTLTLYTGLGLF